MQADLHLINILDLICPSSSQTTHTEYLPPRCIPCCLALSPLCGLLCVNHDSFCETVTLVSEVHRESTLALSLAGEFPPLVDCPMVIVLCVWTERICINYSLSSFSLWSTKLTSEKLIEYLCGCTCVCVYVVCWKNRTLSWSTLFK